MLAGRQTAARPRRSRRRRRSARRAGQVADARADARRAADRRAGRAPLPGRLAPAAPGRHGRARLEPAGERGAALGASLASPLAGVRLGVRFPIALYAASSDTPSSTASTCSFFSWTASARRTYVGLAELPRARARRGFPYVARRTPLKWMMRARSSSPTSWLPAGGVAALGHGLRGTLLPGRALPAGDAFAGRRRAHVLAHPDARLRRDLRRLLRTSASTTSCPTCSATRTSRSTR